LTGKSDICLPIKHYLNLDNQQSFLVSLKKKGASEYTKTSYPVRYGIYDEIKTKDYTFQFNLLGEIKYIYGHTQNWPNPSEWLKRTVGNDWVYYSSGEYRRTLSDFGEYYFPCPFYPSNSIMGYKPFGYKGVKDAFFHLKGLYALMKTMNDKGLTSDEKEFFRNISEHTEKELNRRADTLHSIIKGRISVLPPDARHVDYDVIPVVLADGCLYNCGFCRVKSGKHLSFRSTSDIKEQILNLKKFYGLDLKNYSAIFLANHDVFAAEKGLIEFSLEMAYNIFDFENAYMRQPTLFLFGSADSLLSADEDLFLWLNKTPFIVYINIGLESACDKTLRQLKKPITSEKVRAAFERIAYINNTYDKIEVTSNFLISPDFPSSHMDKLLALTDKSSYHLMKKGTIYLSPLYDDTIDDRGKRRRFFPLIEQLKIGCTLPAYLYLIQRL